MGIQTNWYAPSLAALPRGVVVVEATRAAATLWDGPVASVLEELADQLAADSYPEVVFLGDRHGHPLAGVLLGLSSPHPAAGGTPVPIAPQLGRYPVAGPALWAVECGPPRPILLLLNACPLDLDDWATPALARRVLVYRLTGGERVAPPAFTELGPEADLGRLAAHLRDPAEAVRVADPAALVVDWHGDECRWDAGGVACGLPAAGGPLLRVAHPDGFRPEAVVRRASGAEYRVPLAPATPPAPTPAITLTRAEETVLTEWANGRPFWCGGCRRPHPPGALVCQTGGGPGLFPTLPPGPVAPLYLATDRGGRWHLSPAARGIAVAPDGRVLVCRDGATAGYEFDGGVWAALVDEAARFAPAGDGVYALRP